MIRFSDLPALLPGSIRQISKDSPVVNLLIDSRRNGVADGTLFFAIKGDRHDGHHYIESLYQKGVRQFVVEQEIDIQKYSLANFFQCESSIAALQEVAAAHRKKFSIPIIGITGSNGKTIIKEWLYQLLSADYRVVKNPGSYNSQVGVPLSVWSLQNHHELGIFEAGISTSGEMSNLQKIIQPTVGIISNLGSAHDAGFNNRLQKLQEKLKLFTQVTKIIYCQDNKLIASEVERIYSAEKLFGWGTSSGVGLQLTPLSRNKIQVVYQGKSNEYHIPFRDTLSIENVSHCIAALYFFKIESAEIQKRLDTLKSVSMRMEVKKGVNGCLLVDDTYNNDLAGLAMSLDFLMSLPGKDKSIVLSDIHQSGLSEKELVEQIRETLSSKAIRKLIGIGPILFANKNAFNDLKITAEYYSDTENFLEQFSDETVSRETILIKGSRSFRFERIVTRLQEKVHGTVLEINLNAVVSNLNYFKSKLKPGVKIMAMVKALAYGGGSDEIASLLQYHNIDYLGVAYADEGVQLRKAKISIPIMVMNPSPESFELMTQHNLEPEVYSLGLLRKWIGFNQQSVSKIHLKVETGMNRLGFNESELDELIDLLSANKNLTIASVFSHLAAADNPAHDEFSISQANQLRKFSERIEQALRIKPLTHILNSAGILRYPELQLDMVRVGIGMYGIDPTLKDNKELETVFSLRTTVSQIKTLGAEDTIGYGRLGKSNKPRKIATLSIGYADGYSRSFSNGAGKFLIHGNLVSVVGNVCMDMTMVDVTGLDVSENDEALVFGKELSILQVAKWINTIPYEILTNTGPRVRKIYHIESL